MSSKVDWKKALLGAELSKGVYEKFEDNKDLLIPLLEKNRLSLVKTFNSKDTGTQGFIVKDEDCYYLVFRGTEKDGLDILTDLSARLKLGGGRQKHSGFFKAYESVKDEIFNNIPKNEKVFICGHSLGGALATISFDQLRERNKVSCFTYGAPPVGTYDFLFNREEDSLTRIINHGDIVPRAMKLVPVVTILTPILFKPLRWILEKFNKNIEFLSVWKRFIKDIQADLLKYKQPVSGVLLKGDGSFKEGSDESFSIDVFFKVLFSSKRNEVFEDHSIQRYCYEIERFL